MLPTKNNRLLFGTCGFCLGLFGILYGIFCEKIFNAFMEKDMVLRPGSRIFDVWRSPPVKLTLDFYIFNWTNSEQFQDLSVKPIFEELGPYRFIDKPDKVDIEWHPENASVTYRKRSHYYFDAAGSRGSLDDKIVTVNTLAVALSAKARNWSKLRRAMIDIALNVYHNDITIKKTANELLFGGFEDVLLNIANIIPSSITDVIMPFDKFGYCYPRNGSSEITGVYNIHTGADDIQKLGQIHTWNYMKSTPNYAPQCSKVHGSPGELQPPYLKKNEPIHIFLSDACRSIPLDYAEEIGVGEFQGYKYSGGLRMVDNGTLYPENVCNCNGRCVPTGLVNVSSCWFGSPVFMSYPHFYNADPYYLEQVEGLKPDKEKHELSVVLEKKTGFVLDLKARLQTNLLVEPMTDLSMFRNQRKIFLPLFWFEETTRVTPDLTEELSLLIRLIFISQIFGGLCFVIGVIMLAWQPIAGHINQRLMQHIKITDLAKEQNRAVKTKQQRYTSAEILSLLERSKTSDQLIPKLVRVESEIAPSETFMVQLQI